MRMRVSVVLKAVFFSCVSAGIFSSSLDARTSKQHAIDIQTTDTNADHEDHKKDEKDLENGTKSFQEKTLSVHERDEWIKTINHFLSTIRTMSSSFFQVTTSREGHILENRQGTLTWLRPAHIHFVYDGKPALQVLSDGESLRQKDDDGESMSVSIDSTPARLLLQTTVNLQRDAAILDVIETPKNVMIVLANKDDPRGPSLMLGFRKSPLCLMQWTTVEDSGRIIDVILQKPEVNINLQKKNFKFR